MRLDWLLGALVLYLKLPGGLLKLARDWSAEHPRLIKTELTGSINVIESPDTVSAHGSVGFPPGFEQQVEDLMMRSDNLYIRQNQQEEAIKKLGDPSETIFRVKQEFADELKKALTVNIGRESLALLSVFVGLVATTIPQELHDWYVYWLAFL